MLLLLGAFIAGIITVFAPCVLPLLPVIIGGSVSGSVTNRRRPLLIAASLAVSLLVFTLLLKVTSLLVSIDPSYITIGSGAVIILVGVFSLFPTIYEKLIIALGVQARAQRLMGTGLTSRSAVLGPIITGAALGPVFSSCSPVYAYILATVFPASFGVALGYITAYVLGLSLMLLLIGFAGQRIVARLKWASNPRGLFQRVIAILFIIVGLLVISGYDKRLQTYVAETTPFDFDALSSKLIPSSDRQSKAGVLNVTPYQAPELTGLSSWINSQPLELEKLKGRVVLIDFWTYSCINCIRTQPYLKGWDETYRDSGLTIIGVHAPEFAFEKNQANVKAAAQRAGLRYPIALDNDFATWNAFQNQYWPASYLIDAEGQVRRVHAGEGQYAETEDAIRQLLRDAGKRVPEAKVAKTDERAASTPGETPETYLGTRRASNFEGEPGLRPGTARFTPVSDLSKNRWTLGGNWNVSSESIIAGDNASLRFRTASQNVYLVAGQADAAKITVSLNGRPISQTKQAGNDVKNSAVTVTDAKLYQLVKRDGFDKDSVVELQVPAGTPLTVFTFGQ